MWWWWCGLCCCYAGFVDLFDECVVWGIHYFSLLFVSCSIHFDFHLGLMVRNASVIGNICMLQFYIPLGGLMYGG